MSDNTENTELEVIDDSMTDMTVSEEFNDAGTDSIKISNEAVATYAGIAV